MTERPILFSPPMIRALLGGQKTQTRRDIKSARGAKSLYAGERDGLWVVERFGDPGQAMIKSPYGRPGDRLYVKEGSWIWCAKQANGSTPTGRPKFRYVPVGQHVVYRADGVKPTERIDGEAHHQWRLKVARFMPRWASRLTLEVASVRVERVQEISRADAQAEGMESCTPGDQYRVLWDHINGKREGCTWADNPWVWVVEFGRVKE